MATATDVVLQLPADAQGLNGHLREASLSVKAVDEEGETPQDILAAARADYARMAGALYEVGRYGAVVSVRVDGREAAEISPLSRPARINRIVIAVQPGPPFTFGTARVAPITPGTELPEGFRTGQPAFSGLVGDAARAGVVAWREAGHAKADVGDQSITADHRAARLSADVRLAPGPRVTFGELNVLRSDSVRPERVRQIAGLPTGQVYSPAEVEAASQRLRRTGAFQSVVIEDAEEVGPGNQLDFNATLTDAKPRRFGAGIELSSLEGLTLSGFWMHRNLFGGAEQLRFDGEVSGIGGDSGGIDYVFSTRYSRPATFSPETDFFLSARAQDLDEPEYSERSIRVGGGLLHRFSDTLTGEAGLAYQYSDIRDDLGSRTLEHFLMPISLTMDTRNNELNATAGAYLDLDVTPFIGLNNDAAGARFYADARNYWKLGQESGTIFATRAQIGSIAGAGVTEIPPNMLFFSGGAGTVRGQPYQSLAVDLGGGREVGGRSFLALSAEIRAPIKDKWSMVGFADSGFIGSDSLWSENGEWHSGAGFGVRYDTGFGPIRVDLATPLDSDAGRDFELYIGIGQAF